MPAQSLVVGADQIRLTDGRGRLKLRQVIGPAFPAKLAHARADRTRADKRETLRPRSITVLICSAR